MVSDMGEDLPILKGILNGVVNYHNARRYFYIKIMIKFVNKIKL